MSLRRTISCSLALVLAAVGLTTAEAAPAFQRVQVGSVVAEASGSGMLLGNDLVSRGWMDDLGFQTGVLIDWRAGQSWSTLQPDFTLRIGGVDIKSTSFKIANQTAVPLADGVRVTFNLTGATMDATRVVEVYDGIAGFWTQMTLKPKVPLVLSGYTLDELRAGTDAAPTIHALRAGADWRDPTKEGTPDAWKPDISVGDPHTGTWRETKTAAPAAALEGPAQIVSMRRANDARAFIVAERNDAPSSRAGATAAGVASVGVDHTRDIAGLGPFEESIHVENPTVAPAGRTKALAPGVSYALEAAFSGLALDADDEAWQLAKWLKRRTVPYRNEVTFNSNGTDANARSTGAKDDMDIERVRETVPKALALGVETFILDDGWQARSGDWEPDSPQFPEPRWDGTAASKYRPRFPDAEFKAVREAIAPMKLGLWMSPMHFNPTSATYKAHPEWACMPVGHGLAAANAAQPDSSSNEAGIGEWSTAAIPHIEGRIRHAITKWEVSYFKFDFLAWIDCAGAGDADDMRRAFVAMLDRLRTDHPMVTFQIDETNDYRLFPYQSVTRGPSWFQNGSPPLHHLLHNMWNLSPYVPAYSLGQHFLGGNAWTKAPVSAVMAAAMPSHLTFFSDMRGIPDSVVAEAAAWTAFHRANRDVFTGMTLPLLEDPLKQGWTALQTWDPEVGDGALLAFRQKAAETTRTIPLRAVPPNRTFELFAAPGGESLGTVTSAQLTAGLTVDIPEANGARVVVIRHKQA